MAVDLKLAVILAAVDRLSEPVRRIQRVVKQAAKGAKGLDQQLATVRGQRASIEAFRRLKTQLIQTSRRLDGAQKEVGALAGKMRLAGGATKKLGRQFAAAKQRALNLKRAHREQVLQLERVRRGLNAAGIATRHMATADRRLRLEGERLNRTLAAQARRAQRIQRLGGARKHLSHMSMNALMGGAMTEMAAGTMRRGVKNVMDPFLAFDDALALIRTMPGMTEESTAKYALTARAWSRKHVDTAADFINASYEMLSASLEPKTALAGTAVGLRVARATRGDAADTTRLLATVYNNFGDKTRAVREEMGSLGDILTRTQQTFQMPSMAKLGDSLQYAVAAAKSARVPFEQVLASVGQLMNLGLSSSRAGEAWKASVEKMIEASQKLGFQIARTSDGGMDLIGTLRNIRAKLGDLNRLSDEQTVALTKAFGGPEALAAIRLLSGAYGDLNKNLRTIRQNAGAAAQAQATIEKSTGNQLRIAVNNLTDLKLELMKTMVPFLKGLIPDLKKITRGFTEWVKANPGLAKLAAKAFLLGTLFLSILAPLLSIVGGFLMIGSFGLGAIEKLLTIFEKLRGLASGLKVLLGGVVKLSKGLWVLARRSLAAVARGLGVVVSVGARVGKVFLGMAAGALRAGAAFLATPIGWLTAAFAGLAATIGYVIAKWGELTGQSNTFIKIAPRILERVRKDTAFRKARLQEALKGNKAARRILEQAFPDKPMKELWGAADRKRHAKAKADLFKEVGFKPPRLPSLPVISSAPSVGLAPAGPLEPLPSFTSSATSPGTASTVVNDRSSLHIVINGVTDPKAVADAVMREIAKRKGRMARSALYDGMVPAS